MFPLPLFARLATDAAGAWVTRTRRKVVFLAIAGIFAFTAWSLLTASAVFALADRYGTLAATLMGASMMMVLALAVIAVLRLAERHDRRRNNPTSAALLVAGTTLALPEIIRSRPLLALALVGAGTWCLISNTARK